MLCANVVGTPSVVYDFGRFGAKRFRTEFANAGEDHLFWMELARSGARVAFSSRCEVRCGRGVNVYSGSGWDTAQHLLRIHNEMKYRKVAARLFALTPGQQAHLTGAIRGLRVAFARDVLHRLATRQRLPLRMLAAHLPFDPLSYLRLPGVAASVAAGRLATRWRGKSREDRLP